MKPPWFNLDYPLKDSHTAGGYTVPGHPALIKLTSPNRVRLVYQKRQASVNSNVDASATFDTNNRPK
jgi:hypothetical protein